MTTILRRIQNTAGSREEPLPAQRFDRDSYSSHNPDVSVVTPQPRNEWTSFSAQTFYGYFLKILLRQAHKIFTAILIQKILTGVGRSMLWLLLGCKTGVRVPFPPQCPDRLWSPHSLLYNGFRGALSPRIRRPERESDHPSEWINPLYVFNVWCLINSNRTYWAAQKLQAFQELLSIWSESG